MSGNSTEEIMKDSRKLLRIGSLFVFLLCGLMYIISTNYWTSHYTAAKSSGYFLPEEDYTVTIDCPEGPKKRTIRWVNTETRMTLGLSGVKTVTQVEVDGKEQALADDGEIIVKGCSAIYKTVSVGYMRLYINLLTQQLNPRVYFYPVAVPVEFY